MKKAQKIKAMIQAGKANAEIVKAVPTATLQQVYNHRYMMKKNRRKAVATAKEHYNRTYHIKEAEATPEEEEVIQTILDKHANAVQVGGEHYKSKAIQTILDKHANAVQVGGTHYKFKDIQPWDAIHAWGLGFFSGNVVKYVARHREKNGVEDLKKARHYLDKLIEIMEKK